MDTLKHNILNDRNIFDSLTDHNDNDIYMTGWINKKSIYYYNKLLTENVAAEFTQGEKGYAKFHKFKYNSYEIPYELTISNGLYKDGGFKIVMSPYLSILSIYIKIPLKDIFSDTDYYNGSISSDGDYLYIYADSVDILLLAVIDVIKCSTYNRNLCDHRDYQNSINSLLRGDTIIDTYLKVLQFKEL